MSTSKNQRNLECDWYLLYSSVYFFRISERLLTTQNVNKTLHNQGPSFVLFCFFSPKEFHVRGQLLHWNPGKALAMWRQSSASAAVGKNTEERGGHPLSSAACLQEEPSVFAVLQIIQRWSPRHCSFSKKVRSTPIHLKEFLLKRTTRFWWGGRSLHSQLPRQREQAPWLRSHGTFCSLGRSLRPFRHRQLHAVTIISWALQPIK